MDTSQLLPSWEKQYTGGVQTMGFGTQLLEFEFHF
jgi:hypothetical protein